MKYKRKCQVCGADIVYSEEDEFIKCPICKYKANNPHYIKDEVEDEMIIEDDDDETYSHNADNEIDDEADDSTINYWEARHREIVGYNDDDDDIYDIPEKKLSLKDLGSDAKKYFYSSIICFSAGIVFALLVILNLFVHIGGWIWLLLLPMAGSIYFGCVAVKEYKFWKSRDETTYWKNNILTSEQKAIYDRDMAAASKRRELDYEKRKKEKEECCENCAYFREKNGLASLSDNYYCANPLNVHSTGFMNKEEVYQDVSRDDKCDFFTPKQFK